jgi:hypothetical protein
LKFLIINDIKANFLIVFTAYIYMAFGVGWGSLMFVTGRSSISPISGPGYEHILKSG